MSTAVMRFTVKPVWRGAFHDETPQNFGRYPRVIFGHTMTTYIIRTSSRGEPESYFMASLSLGRSLELKWETRWFYDGAYCLVASSAFGLKNGAFIYSRRNLLGVRVINYTDLVQGTKYFRHFRVAYRMLLSP